MPLTSHLQRCAVRKRILVLVFSLLLVVTRGSAFAQSSSDGPYIVSGGGALLAEHTAGSASLGAGYVTPRGLGFEVELAWAPLGVESAHVEIPQVPPFGPTVGDLPGFPLPEITVKSRLLTLQTSVVGVLGKRGSRVSATLEAGGGIADVHRDAHIKTFVPQIPTLADFAAGRFDVTFTPIERDVPSSQTGLVLGAGGGVEVALTEHLGVGSRVRYQHVFTSVDPLDHARVEARVRWMF